MGSEPDPTTEEIAACERAVVAGQFREALLTRAMGLMLAMDPYAAGRFAQTLVGFLRPDLRRRTPSKLLCVPEARYYRGIRAKERIADLLLYSLSGNYALIVEGKLNAPLGHRQVAHYLKAKPRSFSQGLRRGASVHVALITNKALVPRDRTNSKRWLGAVTWTDLFEEFEAVKFGEPERAERWRAVLRHYRTGGAFGTAVDGVTEPAQLLNSIVFRTVRDLDRALSTRGGWARAAPWDPAHETVVRKTHRGAAMRLETWAATTSRARRVEVRLDRTSGGSEDLRVAVHDPRRSQKGVPVAAAETPELLGRQVTTLVRALVRAG